MFLPDISVEPAQPSATASTGKIQSIKNPLLWSSTSCRRSEWPVMESRTAATGWVCTGTMGAAAQQNVVSALLNFKLLCKDLPALSDPMSCYSTVALRYPGNVKTLKDAEIISEVSLRSYSSTQWWYTVHTPCLSACRDAKRWLFPIFS